MLGVQMPESEMPSLLDVETALAEVAASEPAVVAAYVFGSLARGTAGPLSDVDVGLLVVGIDEAAGVCDRAMDALSRRLRTSRVDVVSLADVPMPLRYRVIRDGSIVLRRDAAPVSYTHLTLPTIYSV